ncbi:riboflavin synthase [Halovenus salina]|uniref:Riboflavin synthase n=1 Tax=Halovenus salina TaxID=1510225 RepID=A0ABD5W9C0_9EURY|nr:riboflavin synthase [Halovenus salina]
MYTGIVETTGQIRDVTQFESGCRLRIAADTAGLDPDDSISISGVCLTAESVGDGWFEAFLSAETVERTYLDELEPDEDVNVETPMPAEGRFDGHVVKGTVDTVTEITDIETLGEDWRFEFSVPDGHEQYLVEKGPVALDGMSLTVADLGEETFSVAVVPTTYEVTTLSEKQIGDPVHFEADILAKYAERQRLLAA